MRNRQGSVCGYLFLINFMLFSPIMAQVSEFSGLSVDGKTYLTLNVEDGKIIKIERRENLPDTREKVYIAPGLLDTQINGYASISFNESGLSIEKVKELTKALWKEGVTTFFPTIITNSPELISENLQVLSSSLSDPRLARSIPGFFLEGPYISPLDGFRGAHDKEWVRKPDWDEFMDFYKASNKKLIQVGLAPETEGAMEFIANCTDKGIMVSLAHHNGTTGQINKAVALGARVSTHLGNGCANLIHRHENPIWPQLANEQLTPTIIADGHHLRPEELKVFYSVKGPENLILVSDATKLAGMPAGEYEWDGKKIIMTSDGMLQYPEQEVLAGASFPVGTGVVNMVNLAGCSLENAIKMATDTPAKVYNLNDRGSIETGKNADLIQFKIEDDQMIIVKTILQGEIVYQK